MFTQDVIKNLKSNTIAVIAGPCVIESEISTMQIASQLKEICSNLDIFFVFKASFDKANRTSVSSYRGPGITKGIKILQKVKQELSIPICTDIHEPSQAKKVAEVADIIQIPAFLCRQTDLLQKAAETGKPVNVKKAQFLSGNDMKNVVEKLKSFEAKEIFLTERGTAFGYNNLVVDFRNMIDMEQFNVPIIYDATHSMQRPGGMGSITGGSAEMAPRIMCAAAGMGITNFFIETHPEPAKAKSDKTTVLDLKLIKPSLEKVKTISIAYFQ